MQNSADKHVLARIRIAARLTQGELADRVGCHKMSIQRIEQGMLKLSPSMAERIAEVFGVSSSWLLANKLAKPELPPRRLTRFHCLDLEYNNWF